MKTREETNIRQNLRHARWMEHDRLPAVQIKQSRLFSPNSNYESIYKVEPPLMHGESKYGYNGVVIRDRVRDVLQCHECGKWFENLGSHVWAVHKIFARDYKIKHGLFITTPLCSRKMSKFYSDNALKNTDIMKVREKIDYSKVGKFHKGNQKVTMAWKNQHNLCPEQIKARYAVVKEQCGGVPTAAQVRKLDHQLWRWMWRNGGRKAVAAILGDEIKNGRYGWGWDEISAIAAIRSYVQKNGYINSCCKDFAPNFQILKKLFGSYRRAMTQAGLVAFGNKYMIIEKDYKGAIK